MVDQPEETPHRTDVEVSHSGNAVTLRVAADRATLTVDEAQALASQLVEAAVRASGDEPEESDIIRIPMQYIHAAAERLEYEVQGSDPVPPIEDEDLAGAKFAEVHCWIREQTGRNAMHIATGWIGEHGWVITEVIEQIAVSRDDFTETEYLPYYEQALIESEVFLYEIEEAESEETEGSADAP